MHLYQPFWPGLRLNGNLKMVYSIPGKAGTKKPLQFEAALHFIPGAGAEI
jgi:hypothetical protein